MRYVVIGNSAAGTSAAEAIRRVDPLGSITVVSDEELPAYSRSLTPNLIAGEVDKKELFYRPANFYQAHNIEPLLGRRAVSLDPAAGRITLDDGKELPYDRLLVATGAAAIRPPIKGIELAFTLRTLEDTQAIMATEAEKAVVLGGGLVGLKVAQALRKRGLKVHVVVKSPHLLSRQLDAQGGEILRRAVEEAGVELTFGQDAREVLGGPDEVILEDGRRLEAEMVVVAKGVRPRAELLEAAGGKVGRGVVVDERMQTSIPHIYAAGDVAEVPDLVTGERIVSAVWPSAVAQGRVAGLNMAGQERRYAGALMPLNAVDLFGVPIVSLGLTLPCDEGYEVLTRYHPERGLYRKLVLKGDVLVGAVLMGEIEKAGVLAALIRQQVDVSQLKGRLIERGFGYAHFVKPMVPAPRPSPVSQCFHG